MGRLGFNLAGQKEIEKAPKDVENAEAPKDVENAEAPVETVVVVPDKQQNQANESSEESRLRSKIKAMNMTISVLQPISIILTLGIIFMLALFVIFQKPQKCSRPEGEADVLKLVQEEFNLSPVETYFLSNFLGVTRDEGPEAARFVMHADGRATIDNCTAFHDEIDELKSEKAELETRLRMQKSLAEERVGEAEKRYGLLQDSYVALQTEQEALSAQFTHKEEELKAEIEKLTSERADLVKKIETGNKKLQQIQQRNSRQQQQQQVAKTTTERNIFNNDQFKKFNDLVKDIETGAVLYDFNGFMKRTDEVFRP